MIERLIKHYRIHKLLLVGMLVFMYVPILYLVAVSFHQDPYSVFPYEFTTQNYEAVVDGKYNPELRNSFQIGFGSGLISMIVGASAAWAVARYRFPLRYAVAVFFVLPLVVPTLITGIGSAMLHFHFSGLADGVLLATVTQSVRGSAFAFLIMMTQLSQYPVELDHAAKVYGANRIQRLKELTLPLLWGSLLGAFLIATIVSFNDYNLTFFTVGASGTIPTLTFAQMKYGLEASLFALSALIVIVSLTIIFSTSLLIQFSSLLDRE